MGESRFGRGFARDVEAILGVLAAQNHDQVVYIYPWEVREALRTVGLRLDKNIPQFVNSEFDWERHEPDFSPDPEGQDDSVEPDDDDYEES